MSLALERYYRRSAQGSTFLADGRFQAAYCLRPACCHGLWSRAIFLHSARCDAKPYDVPLSLKAASALGPLGLRFV